MKKNTGITLVSLVVTIVILIILAGITISQLTGNGLFSKAQQAKEENQKQTATETMNLKITNIQISSYTENEELPSLQYLADKLCEDSDMEYVLTKSKAHASLNKIDVTNISSIYTKLKKYPYEFEINSELQLASIDGVKVATTSDDVTTLKSTIESLETRIKQLEDNSITKDEADSTYIAIGSSNPLNSWTEAFSVTGTTEKSYDFTAYNEVMVVINYTTGNDVNYMMCNSFPISSITSDSKAINIGGYNSNSSSYGQCWINMSNSAISIRGVSVSGIYYNSSATMTVYVR